MEKRFIGVQATTYTAENLPNDKPTNVAVFAYNKDKTAYSAPKTDVEIPRERTWVDDQKEMETALNTLGVDTRETT